MSDIPEGSDYRYKHTYYQLGSSMYAMYFNRIWRQSASVTNDELKRHGVKINVNETFKRKD